MRAALALSVLLLSACRAPDSEEAVDDVHRGLDNGAFDVELNGIDIHYEVHGSGPVLMTVPNAWGLSHEGLRAMYRPLEPFVTMVYFDPRGMGASGPAREKSDLGNVAVREDFHALREHLGLERVNAIGWSNGAMNLIYIASERPEAIAKAIFLHGVASFGEDDVKPMVQRYPDLFAAFARFEEEMASPELTAEERNARVKTFDTEVWFPYMFADPEAGRTILPEIFRDAAFSWDHAKYTQEEWPAFDAREELSRIRAKSLVIAGRHDMMPPASAEGIAHGIDDAEFVVFESSGHFAPIEEQQEFLSTVLDFLEVEH